MQNFQRSLNGALTWYIQLISVSETRGNCLSQMFESLDSFRKQSAENHRIFLRLFERSSQER